MTTTQVLGLARQSADDDNVSVADTLDFGRELRLVRFYG